MPETTTQPLFDQDDLIISAARYYIGRTTAAASAFALQLAHAWHHLTPYVQGILKRELQQAFQADDQHRRHRRNTGPLPLGDDVDREAWEKVRQAWAREPAPEPIKPGPRPQLNLFGGAPQEPENDAAELGNLLGMRVKIMPYTPGQEQPPF